MKTSVRYRIIDSGLYLFGIEPSANWHIELTSIWYRIDVYSVQATRRRISTKILETIESIWIRCRKINVDSLWILNRPYFVFIWIIYRFDIVSTEGIRYLSVDIESRVALRCRWINVDLYEYYIGRIPYQFTHIERIRYLHSDIESNVALRCRKINVILYQFYIVKHCLHCMTISNRG